MQHERNRMLLGQLAVCLNRIFTEPRAPGLNLETLNTVERLVFSARINQGDRLIFYAFSANEIGLLNFGPHDDMYRWVDSHERTIGSMLAKVAEVARDRPITLASVGVRAVRRHEDDPLALEAASQFERMLEGGIAQYLAALDEDQRGLVAARPQGVLVVKGGAGTGKTAIAIHRALERARQPSLAGPDRVLYLCYNRQLAAAVQQVFTALAGPGWAEQIEVRTFHTWCEQLLRAQGGPVPNFSDEDQCRQQVFRAFGKLAPEKRRVLEEVKLDRGRLDGYFIDDEISSVIKHRGISRREDYLAVGRQGRKVRLTQAARDAVWDVFEQSEQYIAEQGICRWSDLPLLALQAVEAILEASAYREVIVDEGQDCSPVMMQLALKLAGGQRNRLTVFVDPAQCIFPNGFQWTQEELMLNGTDRNREKKGIHIRWVKKNYRMTSETYLFTQPLLAGHTDLRDELTQWYAPTRSGPLPILLVAGTDSEVRTALADRIAAEATRRPLEQIAVLAATHAALQAMHTELRDRGVDAAHIQFGGDELWLDDPTVKLLTMQGAKGLDFPVVFVIGPGVNDLGGPQRTVLPEPARTLHVALTRASEQLVVGLVDGAHHPAFSAVLRSGYVAEGPRATEFRNRWAAV